MSDVYTVSSRNTDFQNATTDEAERFVQRLVTMPLADWFDAATQADAPGLASAIGALQKAIDTPDTLFRAWLVRDGVATAWHRFDSPEGRRLCRHAHAAAAKAATERAAESLLVRSQLSAEDLRALYGGFARTAPL